tara:strand:+ start:46 stop:387 length:342 start_codon:yes stop_codon:yes gene_type:complete
MIETKLVKIKTLKEEQVIKFPKNTYHHIYSPYFWVDVSDRVGKIVWKGNNALGVNLSNPVCFSELCQENVDLSKEREETTPKDFECDLIFNSKEEEHPESWEDKVLIQVGESS